MFEALIQKNIEVSGGVRDAERVLPARVSKDQREAPSLSAPPSRVQAFAEPAYGTQRNAERGKNEPSIVFEEDTPYTQPQEEPKAPIPWAAQMAEAAARAAARESRRCDRRLTL